MTVFQEYRGFVLDGGGYDGIGQNGHGGGHRRLSPAKKELLLEIDSVAHDPSKHYLSATEVHSVLVSLAKGFSNGINGAGILAYWVHDQITIPPFIITFNAAGAFSGASNNWFAQNRNKLLKGEFYHTIFGSSAFFPGAQVLGVTSAHGTSILSPYGVGTVVFSETIWNHLGIHVNLFIDYVTKTTAHEIMHGIIEAPQTARIDNGEHEVDPDLSDPILGDFDLKYLMIPDDRDRLPVNLGFMTDIYFSDLMLGYIDLSRKESVEV